MKILVLGASGMAGHTIALYLVQAGHEVIGFDRNKINYCQSIQGDATDFNNLRCIINDGNFDGIINAIGILNENAERNKSLSILLNSYLPHFLSDLTKDTKTKIIQMSTDCVFSGKLGSYSEHSFRDGESFYDRTKALGEIENGKDLTFRESIIGPDMNKDGIGLFNWFMKQSGGISGYSQVYWTGVTTLTLAKAMEQALCENLSGIYNLVNNEPISKYELLRLFNKYFSNAEKIITPTDKLSANKSLRNNRTDFTFIVPSYDEMVAEMKEWVFSHKEFYPHYFKLGEDING